MLSNVTQAQAIDKRNSQISLFAALLLKSNFTLLEPGSTEQ